MNKRHLKAILLEAPLLIKGFVKGDKACNYELYLIELLNASKWRRKRFQSPFIHSSRESNGECDAYSGLYGLDFKLVASKTALQARSIFSTQFFNTDSSVTVQCGGKSPGSMFVTRLAQALRGKNVDELLSIQKQAGKRQGIYNDIAEYMETISMPKNLLLFYPYRFSFDSLMDISNDCHEIINTIDKDFTVSLSYRSDLLPEYETYFSFLYDYSFVLCQYKNKELCLLEIIPIELSPTFMHLALKYGEMWHEKYDAYLQELRESEKR